MLGTTKKVAAITAPFPGAKRPIEEGEKLGWWEAFYLKESEVIRIPDADVYVFGAFHPGYTDLILSLKRLGKEIVILWTSSIGEVDLCPPEQEYLPAILQDPIIDRIWFGDMGFARAYPGKGFFARYPLCVNDIPKPDLTKKQDIITLTCPSTSKKNILTQLIAVKLLQESLQGSSTNFTLHTNVQGYDWILKDIRHVRHGWLADKEYKDLIACSKVNLAVSHCETFNYQVAEAALLGTPSVVSPVIPLPGIHVKDTGSVHEIARMTLQAFDQYETYTEHVLSGIIGESKVWNEETGKVLVSQLGL